MDLTPFFRNVERIADALELIARNTERPVISVAQEIALAGPLAALVAPEEVLEKPLLEALKIEALPIPTAPVAEPPAPVIEPLPPLVAHTLVEDLIDAEVRRLYASGVQSANAIAKALTKAGIERKPGRSFNNVTVKPIMDRLGLVSSWALRDAPVTVSTPVPVEPKPAAAPAPTAPESAPIPEVARTPVEVPTVHLHKFVEKPVAPVKGEDDHLNFRHLLSTETRARLEAHERITGEGRRPTDQELVDAAIAAGKVTVCEPCTDSSGYNHLKGQA